MLIYKIQLMNGTTITVNDVTTVWNDGHGVYFEAGKETSAYVPHNNLANYQLVVDKPVTSSVTTTVDGITISSDGPVTINSNQDWNGEEAIRLTELVCKCFMNGLKQQPKGGR